MAKYILSISRVGLGGPYISSAGSPTGGQIDLDLLDYLRFHGPACRLRSTIGDPDQGGVACSAWSNGSVMSRSPSRAGVSCRRLRN